VTEPADTPAVPPGEDAGDDRPLPVLAEPRPIEPQQAAPLPAVVAAGTMGFLAGIAAWMLVRVLRRPRGSASVRALRQRRSRGLEISATRSFLVDVHLLRDR